MKHKKFVNFNSAVADKVLLQVQAQWNKAGIKTQRKDKVKAKILELYNSYRTVQKRKGKTSNELKEQTFMKDMDKYFFIAHKDSNQQIETDRFCQHQKDEDIKFFDALKVLIGTEDKKYSRKIEQKLVRES